MVAFFATYFVSFAGFCHQEEPSILDFEIKEDILSIKIQTYFEVLSTVESNKFDLRTLNNFDKTIMNFDEISRNAAIVKLVFQNWSLIRTKFFFNANRSLLDLKLINVEVSPINSHTDTTVLFVRINARVPHGSDFITFSWDENLGDLVIREQGKNGKLYSAYLVKGAMSSKIYLQKEKF